MKIKNLLIVYGLLASGILSACRMGHNDGSMSIRIVNTDDYYQFEASYNSRQTRQIERYISRRIQPNDVLNKEDHQSDITIIMNDRTTFRIKSYPGELKIMFDKNKNSERAYHQVNDICQGVRDLLKPVTNKG